MRTEQTFGSSRSFGVIFLNAMLWRENGLLALRGCPQPPKCKRDTFTRELNAIDDAKTPELAKSGKGTENICDRLWHLSRLGKESKKW